MSSTTRAAARHRLEKDAAVAGDSVSRLSTRRNTTATVGSFSASGTHQASFRTGNRPGAASCLRSSMRVVAIFALFSVPYIALHRRAETVLVGHRSTYAAAVDVTQRAKLARRDPTAAKSVPEPSSAQCVMFRATGRCDPYETRTWWNSLHDVQCSAVVPADTAGYCECGDGTVRGSVWCGHTPFKCAAICASDSEISIDALSDWTKFSDALAMSHSPRAANASAAARSARSKQRARGIVTVAGRPSYTISALMLLFALRRHGCTLPLEIWHDNDPDLAVSAVVAMLAHHGASVRSFASMDTAELRAAAYPDATRIVMPDEPGFMMEAFIEPLRRASALVPKRSWANSLGYMYKTSALLQSSFDEVLWLDADVLPLRDPTFLFESEAYTQSGALFWPDYDYDDAPLDLVGSNGRKSFVRSASGQRVTRNELRGSKIATNPFWNFLRRGARAGRKPSTLTARMATWETGQMVLHVIAPGVRQALMLAHHFLRERVHFYDHHMLRFAFLALDTPHHLVATPVGSLGYAADWHGLGGGGGGTAFCGNTMAQYAPHKPRRVREWHGDDASMDELLFAHRNLAKWGNCRCAIEPLARCSANAHQWSQLKPGMGDRSARDGVASSSACACAGYETSCVDLSTAVLEGDAAPRVLAPFRGSAWLLERDLNEVLEKVTACPQKNSQQSLSPSANFRPKWWVPFQRSLLYARAA